MLLPYCVHLIEVTLTTNRPVAEGVVSYRFFRNVKGWSKANVVRSEKTAIGWIFKLLQG